MKNKKAVAGTGKKLAHILNYIKTLLLAEKPKCSEYYISVIT